MDRYSIPPKLICSFIVALAFALASTATYGSHQWSKVRRALAPQTVTVSLADYGAVGDGTADDGPALQAALEALADAGGGDLFVPDGHYAIATSVSVNFAGRASSVTIHGTPSSLPEGSPTDFGRGLNLTAEFLIKTGTGHDAISLQNLSTLMVQDLVFIGDQAVDDDARIVLSITGVEDATLSRCEFYGLASFGAGGAIIYAAGGSLKIADSAFLGCAANSGISTSIVQTYYWKQISVTGTRFVDYGNRPDYFSKTTYQSPFSWVNVGGAAPLTNVSPRRDVIIKDVFFDEGAYIALSIRPAVFAVPGGGAISLLYVSNLYVNVTNLAAVGLLLDSVDNVFIEKSHFGWSHNARAAMEFSSVRNVLLNQIECVLSADTIIADPTVGELSVINSVYGTLASEAPVTRVITTADSDAGPAQYVNQTFLDALGHPPDIPAYVYWSQQRARCSDDAQCSTDEALLGYLSGDPAPTFSISGRLEDTNGNPIAAATVSLGGTHNIDTFTDSDGSYRFAGLATSGEYTVTPSKTFYTFNATGAAPGTVNLSFVTPGREQIAGFTGTQVKYSIKGRINSSVSGSGVSGVWVTLTGGPQGFAAPPQGTNELGDYSFDNLPGGYEYMLTPTANFYSFAPTLQTLVLAGEVVNLNFLGTPQTHSISGRITAGAQALAEATVRLSGDTSKIATTDADGHYVFDEVAAGGSYVVTASKRHYTFASETVDDLLDDRIADFIGALLHYNITGSVVVEGSSLSGATIALSGSQAATAVTGNNGGFVFDVPAGGNYTVTVAKEGYSMAPSSIIFDDLDQNQNPSFSATSIPLLLTDGTDRAVAFNSLTLLAESFDLFTTPFDFGPDRRTRVALFALHVPDNPALILAQAEDSLGNVYSLTVEFVGPLADAADVKQLSVKLNSQLQPGADIRISIRVAGITSNTVLIRLNPAD